MKNFYKSKNLSREHLEEILFSLDLKVYYIFLIFQLILFIGFDVLSFILSDNKNSFVFIFIQLCVFIILVFFISIIKNDRFGDYLFSGIVISFDITSMLLAIKFSNEESNYIRMVYQFLCFSLILMNGKSNLRRFFFITLIVLKIVILLVISSYYNYKQNKVIIFLDVFMIINSFAMLFINRIIKSIFLEIFFKLNDKNLLLEKKLHNILNSIKYPVISIDLKEKEILLNSSFFSFFNQNLKKENNDTNLLFDKNKETDYFNTYHKLIENLNSDEKIILEKIYDKYEIDQNEISLFKTQILILNKIFRTFLLENQTNCQNSEGLKFLNYFVEKEGLLKKNWYISKGKFKIVNGFSEQTIEITSIWNILNYNHEVLDIMINDYAVIRKPEFNFKNFIKIFTHKIAQNLESPLNSLILITKKIGSKLQLKKFEKNISNNINEINNDLNIIEGQGRYISCLINNLKDCNKHIQDFEINLVEKTRNRHKS